MPKKKRGPSLRARILFWIFLVGSFCVGGAAGGLRLLIAELPDLRSLEDYRPPVTNNIYDVKGRVVARFYEQRREVVAVQKLPAHVKNAFIAAEDAAFYQHEGLDYMAIFAAVVSEVKRNIWKGPRRGGSTITQQTAKTFLLSPKQTYTRKLKEAILAKRIEDHLTKDEILHLYLNQIYFGEGAYGVEEAARTYYGIPAKDLSLAQAAALASIPKSPSRINPVVNPERVRARRSYVLEQMVKNRLCTAEDAEKAKAEPVYVSAPKTPYVNIAPYFADEIRRKLKDVYDEETLKRGGLKVFSTLDGDMQRAANRAVVDGLKAVDKRQGYRGPVVRMDPDERRAFVETLEKARAERLSSLGKASKGERWMWDLSALATDDIRDNADVVTRRVRARTVARGDTVGALVTAVDDGRKSATVDVGTGTAVLNLKKLAWARPFHPTKWTAPPKRMSDLVAVGDVVLVRIEELSKGKDGKSIARVTLDQEPKVEGGLVVVDPHTHAVLAMVGGFSHARSKFNRVTQAKRQPGSAFKPFLYAQAIESRAFTSIGRHLDSKNQMITDAPKVFFDRWTGKKWNPRNSGGKYRGDITLRTCLTFSVNTCSITLLESVGIDQVHNLAVKAEIVQEGDHFPRNLTLALGTAETTLLRLVNAYTVFPGGGEFGSSRLINKVRERQGGVFRPERENRRVLSAASAYVMTDLMRSVVENGTARGARDLGRAVGGKTGTTNNARSVWFVGFTPDLVAGAYVGFDDNAAMGHREYGGRAALPIWLSFMKDVKDQLPDRDFEMPDGVVRKLIDGKSGLLVEGDVVETPTAADLLARIDEAPDGLLGFDDAADDVLPPSEPGDLPEGAYMEVFLDGTEPTEYAEDLAPPPLEFFEAAGGLAP